MTVLERGDSTAFSPRSYDNKWRWAVRSVIVVKEASKLNYHPTVIYVQNYIFQSSFQIPFRLLSSFFSHFPKFFLISFSDKKVNIY